MAMSSPQVFGPYLALVLFLIAAFLAVGRKFWTARGVDRAYPLARVSLAIPLAVFGAEHLTSAHAMMKLVPSWIPGKLFWTYFVGIALIAAALSFIFRVWIRLSATLLGIMFLCFVAMMDIPGTIAAPHNRFTWTLAAREFCVQRGRDIAGDHEQCAGTNAWAESNCDRRSLSDCADFNVLRR